MKNLKLYSEFVVELELQSEEETLLLSAIDIERNRLFFASSANLLYRLNLLPPQKQKLWGETQLSVEGEPIDLEPGDCITALDHIMEKEALIMGTSNGYLLLHNVDDNTTEVVGQVEGGIRTIAPSPDGALLAVTAGFGQILVMTHDWEVLYENTLDHPELNETTLSGDTGDSADNTIESHISWRGDGKYFASLSATVNSSSLQKLRIWERESGALHAASESKVFMGASLDWMPSGAKLVAVYDRKTENKCPLIVFFERNGLERSSFSIDEPPSAAVELLNWNCASDLLAAVVRWEGYDAVKIWSFSNNHWYLKQEIRYSKKDRVKFTWDPTKATRLMCWTLGGKITTFDFVWVTAIMDNSMALVIDNSNILVTPLAISLMPPPMSSFKLKFPCAVQDMAFLCRNSKSQLAVTLSDGSLSVVELPVMDTWDELEGREIEIEMCHNDVTSGPFRHLIWLDTHILLGVSHCEFSQADNVSKTSLMENGLSSQPGEKECHSYSLQEIELICSENSVSSLVTSSGWHAKIFKHFLLKGSVIALAHNPAKIRSAFIEFDGGSVVEYCSDLGMLGPAKEAFLQKHEYGIGFSSSCPWMKAVAVSDNEIVKTLVFGLDEKGRLQVGGSLLCNNCSSFSFYSNTVGIMQHMATHLILTTKQDLLFIISMDDILHENPEINSENFVQGNIKSRGEENRDSINIWERGAKVVGVIHGDEAAVILQAVRGNLECIYPRKLVLASIINALLQGRFKDAILMVRRHRIDLNVIADHYGWQNFLGSAAEFVKQVNNLSHITEFICAMKNENVMETLYKNVVSLPPTRDSNAIQLRNSEGFDAKSKVSSVLLAIRKALEEQLPESPARELCILTTLARSEPPALEEALKRIKVIREKELLRIDDPWRKSYPTSEEALKHLLWLSDSEAVYEAALGLYDLNLTAIVALNSQKDPKEFLPFLQGLERMPLNVMQYTIDLRLHRYESALKHIFSAGESYHEDCLNLMKNNPQLFPLGLQLFNRNTNRNRVLDAWGDHLCGEKSFEDAATMYLCCSSLPKALRAYRDCGNWKGVLSVAGLLKLGKDKVLQLASELCEELQALGKSAEAARIALEYCGDVASGVGCLINAREWEEALRIGFMHGRGDLVSETKDAALECANTLISEYEEGLEKVGKYLARYLAVRQRRLLLAAKLQSEDRSIDFADDDGASETSSNFSGMSAYTRGSRRTSGASVSSSTGSKAREMRHLKKKGGKIRAGSPGEEMALVDHIKGLSLTAGARRELKSLVNALVMFAEEETARKLQRVAYNFQLSQYAAVKLAEDTILNDNMDETTHTLEHYIQNVRCELPQSEAMSWLSKVLLPP